MVIIKNSYKQLKCILKYLWIPIVKLDNLLKKVSKFTILLGNEYNDFVTYPLVVRTEGTTQVGS